MVGEQKKFEIATPYGTLTAIESPDMENPGIVIMFLDPSGTEYVSCSMQVLPKTNSLATQIYRGGVTAVMLSAETRNFYRRHVKNVLMHRERYHLWMIRARTAGKMAGTCSGLWPVSSTGKKINRKGQPGCLFT